MNTYYSRIVCLVKTERKTKYKAKDNYKDFMAKWKSTMGLLYIIHGHIRLFFLSFLFAV